VPARAVKEASEMFNETGCVPGNARADEVIE